MEIEGLRIEEVERWGENFMLYSLLALLRQPSVRQMALCETKARLDSNVEAL